jgi:PAS domain S-box-containing protein
MIKFFHRSKNQTKGDEMNFSSFFHSSPDLLFVFDPESYIIEVNKTAADKLGYKTDELLGKSMFDLHPPGKRAECERYLNEILDGKRSYCPLPLVMKSGELLIVETKIGRGVWNGADVIYSVSKDVTDRVKAEEAARENEERYRILFSNINDAVFVHEFTDDEMPGKFIEANDVACQRLGYTREELLNMSPKDIDAPEGWALVPGVMAKLKADSHIMWEGIHVTKGGKKIPVEISNHLFEMEGRRVILSAVRDITDRKASEELLRRSEEKYRKIFENVRDTFYQADINGIITDISPSIERYSGYQPDELIGMKVETLYNDPKEREALLKILYEKGEVRDYIIHLVHKDRRLVYVSANIHLLYGSGGRPFSIEGSLRDVSERFQAQEKIQESEQLLRKQNEEYAILTEELKIARDKAEESDHLKSAFLANMSHEIRTPMNGIVGFSQMLGDPSLRKDEREAFIKIVNSSCEQLLHIINDIIDISKIEAGQVDFLESTFSIRELLEEVYSFFLPAAKEIKIELALDPVPADIEENIISDRTKIRQMLDNLMSNALKFTNSGRVVISCGLEDQFIRFMVKDTGIGIRPGMQEIIFERFRQADTSFAKTHSGTGLGLSISKAFVEKMGGSIGVISEEGKGSSFWFRLPYNPFTGGIENEVPVTKKSKAGEKITVLVVEDEEINWLYINEILKKQAKLLHAVNGVVALDLVKKNQDIDLVLMDIKLPDINGLELTKMIKAINKNLPVVAQTAYALAGDREKALNAGCVEYLTKPVRRDELLNLVSDFCK